MWSYLHIMLKYEKTLQFREAAALFDRVKNIKQITLQKKKVMPWIYVEIDKGIHNGEMKVAWNEKRKKLCGLSFSINIANFEKD